MNHEEQHVTKTEAQAARSSPRVTDRPKEEKPEDFNATVRIAKDSSVRKLITYVMSRLEGGGVVTLQALNICVRKAILVALITRDRLGDIYQLNSLLVVQESSDKTEEEDARTRTSSGLQIILSKDPLDSNDVGYQKPRPKGFASHLLQRKFKPYISNTVLWDLGRQQERIDHRDKGPADDSRNEEKDSQPRRRPGRRPKQTEYEEKPAPDQAAAGKNRRRRQPRNSNAQDKERSSSEEKRGGNGNRGRFTQSKRESYDDRREDRGDRRGNPDNRQKQSSPPGDYDYMGREVPRNNRR